MKRISAKPILTIATVATLIAGLASAPRMPAQENPGRPPVSAAQAKAEALPAAAGRCLGLPPVQGLAQAKAEALPAAAGAPRPVAGAAAADSSAGGPAAVAETQWIHPDWNDPGIRLADVWFEVLPMSEFAKVVRQRFTNAFDVIIPGPSQNSLNAVATLQPQQTDLGSLVITLHLKDVTATELFNAINLTFEAENTDARWELRNNGDRPLALLKSIPAWPPGGAAAPRPQPADKGRQVYYVGDLLENGATMPDFYDTICQVYDLAFPPAAGEPDPAKMDIKFHGPSQLLIVSATPDRLAFVFDTLGRLREKANADARRAAANAKK